MQFLNRKNLGDKMKSFNQELKNEIVAEIIKHREQDQIIQGTYGETVGGEWKGCAVGCAIHSLNLKKGKDFPVSDHGVYETEFGIPIILARLEDKIFEGLSAEDCKTWPENFMSAIPVNTDLSLVWPRFAIWLLTDKSCGVIQYSENKDVIQNVSDLYSRIISGVIVNKEDWISARVAADAYAAAAATYAAYAAASAATYAASAAAYAASTAADYAAADAAAAAGGYADAAAERKHFRKMSDKLIDILKETK